MYNKNCILYDNKTCDECGDCNFCDINSDKICDNCGECLSQYDYTGIQVDDLIIEDNYSADINTDEYHGHGHCCGDDCECDKEDCHDGNCNCGHNHN